MVAALWSLLLRLWAGSWSVRAEGVDRFDRALAAGEKLLAVIWHGKYLPLFPLLAGRDVLVFTSRSARGDIIAELCRRFGYRAAQIRDRDRRASLDLMRELLRDETGGVIIVDGPLGPYHEVKRGAVVLASEQERLVFPATVGADRVKRYPERWDRMEIPKLFSRAALVIGEPFRVPAELSEKAERAWKGRIQQALDEADRRAERLLASWESA